MAFDVQLPARLELYKDSVQATTQKETQKKVRIGSRNNCEVNKLHINKLHSSASASFSALRSPFGNDLL